MFVSSLSVRSFKNETDCSVGFCKGVNVICGANAAGKTNLLEAVFLFAAGKSFRACKDREMIAFGADSASVGLEFCDRLASRSFGINLYKNRRREILREGVRVTKLSEFLGVFRAVIFTPDHLSLIKGAPEFRRRFADLAICQSFPRYVAAAGEYGKLLSQKNAYLKSGRSDDALLDVYNEKLAAAAGVITVNRFKFLRRLETEAQPFHADMTGGEKLEIVYSSQTGGEPEGIEQATQRYAALLAQKKEIEKRKFGALYGPHKDDFAVLINGKNARTFASQGQQRSAVLSLKLAEGELSAKMTGEYPVFLLDDVLSELDASRKGYILSRIAGKQVLITGCDSGDFVGVNAENLITVDHGVIKSNI